MQFFWHIGIQGVDRSISNKSSTIHGNKKLHSIKNKSYQNVFAFDRRNGSCFYSICIEGTQSNDTCENETNKYVKAWKHTEINTMWKIPLVGLEKMESKDTTVSIDGDRVYNLVREGQMLQLNSKTFFIC